MRSPRKRRNPATKSIARSLPAGLAFYRGACFAALGRTDEAREKFETFLTYQPNASLDPSAYPPKVIAALEDTRRGMNVEKEKPAETGTLATSYRAYQAPIEKGAEEAGEDWAEGPVRFLLTGEQKLDYERLSRSGLALRVHHGVLEGPGPEVRDAGERGAHRIRAPRRLRGRRGSLRTRRAEA